MGRNEITRHPVRMGPWHPTRAQASAAGATQYFTGKPCLRGHIAPRAVSSANCIACIYENGVRLRTSPNTAQQVRDYMRDYVAKRVAVDPEFKDRRRKAGQKQDSKPGRRQRQNERRKWRLIHDEEYRNRVNDQSREVKAKWKRENPEAVQAHDRNRRAQLAGSEGFHTAADIELIHARQKYKCACCGKSTKEKKHVDHIVPISRGGSNWPSNLQILCPPCNLTKAAKDPIEFANQRGFLF